MNVYIFDAPFLSDKDLKGLPRIMACAELVPVLRKSEAETWKSPLTPLYKGEGQMSPPFCKGGLGRIYG